MKAGKKEQGSGVRRTRWLGIVVSHPSAMKLRMDGARGCNGRALVGKTRGCGIPGLKIQTGGTRHFGWVESGRTKRCGVPPIRDETADGWGTELWWENGESRSPTSQKRDLGHPARARTPALQPAGRPALLALRRLIKYACLQGEYVWVFSRRICLGVFKENMFACRQGECSRAAADEVGGGGGGAGCVIGFRSGLGVAGHLACGMAAGRNRTNQ